MPRKRAQPAPSEGSTDTSSPALTQPAKKKRKTKASTAKTTDSESSFNTNDVSSSSSSQVEQQAEVEVVSRQVPSYRDIQTTATADGESPRVTAPSTNTTTIPSYDALGISGNVVPQTANNHQQSFAGSASSGDSSQNHAFPQSSSAESLTNALGPLFGQFPSVVGSVNPQEGYPPPLQWPSDNPRPQHAADHHQPNRTEYAPRPAYVPVPVPLYMPLQYMHPRPAMYLQSTDPANYHFICPSVPRDVPIRDCPVLTCPVNCGLHGMPTTFGPPIYGAHEMNLQQQLGGQPDEPVFGPTNMGTGMGQVSSAYSGLLQNNAGNMGFGHIPSSLNNFNPNAYVPVVPDWAREMQTQQGTANLHRVAQHNNARQAQRMRQEQAAYGDQRPFCSYCLNNIAFCGGVLDCCSHLLYEHEFASLWMSN